MDRILLMIGLLFVLACSTANAQSSAQKQAEEMAKHPPSAQADAQKLAEEMAKHPPQAHTGSQSQSQMQQAASTQRQPGWKELATQAVKNAGNDGLVSSMTVDALQRENDQLQIEINRLQQELAGKSTPPATEQK